MKSFESWAKANGFQNKLERDLYDIEYTNVNTQCASIGYEAGQQSRQEEVDTLKEKIAIYENSISLLRKFHSGFNESSDSAYIVGVMDGFFECLDEELLK